MRVGWLGELSSGHYMAISSMNTLQIVVSCKKSTRKWRRGIIHSNKGVTGSGQAIEDTGGGEYDHNVVYKYIKHKRNKKRRFCCTLNGRTAFS